MGEQLHSVEPLLNPAERVWRAVVDLEMAVHDGDLTKHDPHEQVILSWNNGSCVRRFTWSYIGSDLVEKNGYYPLFQKTDDGTVWLGYELGSDDNVWQLASDASEARLGDISTAQAMRREIGAMRRHVINNPEWVSVELPPQL